jgi:hypothetical protein
MNLENEATAEETVNSVEWLKHNKRAVNPDESLAELIHNERRALKKLQALKVNGTPMSKIDAARTEYTALRERRLNVEKAAMTGSIVRLF